MKRVIQSILLFVLAFSVLTVATLPTHFAVGFMPVGIPLQLVGPQGTIWRGGARNVSWNNQSFGKLEWTLSPFSLLLAKLNADFKLQGEGLEASGEVTVWRDQSVMLEDTTVKADIARLPLQQADMMVVPEGQAHAVIQSLSLINQKIDSIDADLHWAPARISSPADYELGEINLVLTGTDGNIEGDLKSQKGPIDARGKLNISASGLLKADVKLTPTESAPDDLRDMLPMIGKPDSKGTVRIKQQIQIPGWPA